MSTATTSASGNGWPPRPLLDKRAVAQWLGVSTRKIDRLIAAEQFPRGLRVGDRQRWRPEAIERYLKTLEESPP